MARRKKSDAAEFADLCGTYGLPARRLTPDEQLGLLLNLDRQQYRRAVAPAVGVGWALSSEPLPFDYFRAQTYDDATAADAAMQSGFARLTAAALRH